MGASHMSYKSFLFSKPLWKLLVDMVSKFFNTLFSINEMDFMDSMPFDYQRIHSASSLDQSLYCWSGSMQSGPIFLLWCLRWQRAAQAGGSDGSHLPHSGASLHVWSKSQASISWLWKGNNPNFSRNSTELVQRLVEKSASNSEDQGVITKILSGHFDIKCKWQTRPLRKEPRVNSKDRPLPFPFSLTCRYQGQASHCRGGRNWAG